jgi:RHS repeat-associated protein
MLITVVSPARNVTPGQSRGLTSVAEPASFSTSMMAVWTATNATTGQGELVPISGQPPNLGTGSPKAFETGYIANAVATTADGREALVSAGDAYFVSLGGSGSAPCNTQAIDPVGVALTPNGDWGFLADAAPLEGALYAVHLSGGGCSVISPPVLAAGSGQYAAVAACPDGNTVVATDAAGGVLDIGTGLDSGGPSNLTWTQVGVPVGNIPDGVACSGGFAYVTDSSSDIVTAVELSPPYTTSTTTLGSSAMDPIGIAVADGNLYTANSGSGTVSIVPLGASQAPAPVGVGSDPVAVTAEGGLVFVANEGSNNVSVLSGSTVVQTVSSGLREPEGVAVGITPLAPGLSVNEDLGNANYLESCDCSSEQDVNELVNESEVGDSADLGDQEGLALIDETLGGDPVDTATGNFTYSVAGFHASGLGAPMSFSLTYNSALRGSTDPTANVGYGWSASPTLSLQIGSGQVTVEQEDGAQATFYTQSGSCPVEGGAQTVALDTSPPTGSTYLCAAPRVQGILFANGSPVTSYTLERFYPSFESLTFNASGVLTAIADSFGNTTVVTVGVAPGSGTCPSTAGVASCTTFAAPSGRTLTIEENSAAQVIAATDSVHTVSLSYCTSNTSICATGDLSQAVLSATGDSGTKTWSFTYDETSSLNALATVTDPSSNTVVTNTYDDASASDAAFGRVTKQVNAVSDTWTFNYGGLDTTTGSGAVAVTDPNGNEALDTYAAGVLVGMTTGYGTAQASTTQFDRDPGTLLVTQAVDPNGNVSAYARDAEGRLTAYEDGRGNVVSFTYANPVQSSGAVDPAFLEPTLTQDASGQTCVTNTWNTTNGALTQSVLEPNGCVSGTLPFQTTNYFYASSGDGELTSVQDPQGRGVLYGYDAGGDLTSVIEVPNWSQDHTSPNPSATEPETTYGYDSVGRLTSTVAPDGNVTGCGCAASYTTAYGSLNAYDEPITVTYPPAGTASEADHLAYTKDGLENSDKVETTSSSTVVTQTTWGYDNQDELTSVTVASGSSVSSKTQYAYDGDGNVDSMTDPSGNLTTYQFTDPAYPSALTKRTDPKPTTNGTAPVYEYFYDPAGNLVKSVDPKPDTLSFFYDADNQLCIEYSGTLTNPTCGSPPSGAISFRYDVDERRIKMVDSTGTTSWTYNSANNVTSLQNGAGTTLTYGYNLDGQVLCIGYPVTGAVACPQSSAGAGAGDVDYGYTGTGRIKNVTDYLGNETQYGYDADGNATSVTYPGASGASAAYGYDGADNMTSAALTVGTGDNPNGAALSDSFTYGTEEQLASDTDYVASYGYDAKWRLATSNGADAYSPNDQICWSDTAPTAATTCASPPTGSTVTNYFYNLDSELTSTTTGSTTTDYGYDLDGNRCYAGSSTGTCLSPPSGSSTYHWNAFDQMCWSATGGATSSTCSSPPTGATTYAYDGDGLLATTTPSAGSASTLTWDTVSDTAPHVVLDGTNAYIYGRDMTGAGTTAPIEEINLSTSATTYTYSDRTGVEDLLSSAGVVEGANTYSDYGVQTPASWSSASIPFGYKGYYTAGPGGFDYLITRNYDPATGQFVSLDPAVATTDERYAYANDRPTALIDPSGLTCGDDEAYKYATQANKLEHVFTDKHNLEPLVQQFGSREAVVRHILNGLKDITPASGVFEKTITVGGRDVIVRGAVVGGITKIGTAFTP